MSRPHDSTPGALLTYLQALGTEVDVGFLRETLRVMLQVLMEMEVSAAIEASPYERNGTRRAYRNGYRERVWRSALGEIPLRIPKLRKGTYYPSFIDSLEEAERALLTLVQEAYLQGVSSRNVGATLERLGISPVHPRQVADLCARLDDMVYEFRERGLDDSFPSLWVDVLKLNIQHAGHIARYELALAVGIQADGGREILGFEVTRYAEGRDFWLEFFDHLKQRGLRNVEVVLSDAHDGLKPALREALPGTAWQARREQTDVVPQAFISAVSPVLWVDTRVPDNGQIVSSLSNARVDSGSVFGHIEEVHDHDLMLATRIAGALLIEIQAGWRIQDMRHELIAVL